MPVVPEMVRQIKADKRVGEFCEQNGIKELSLFGSVIRDDFGPNSDIDVLVEFKPGQKVSFLDIARMEKKLSILFGRPVELVTIRSLSRYFRDDVLRSRVMCYVS